MSTLFEIINNNFTQMRSRENRYTQTSMTIVPKIADNTMKAIATPERPEELSPSARFSLKLLGTGVGSDAMSSSIMLELWSIESPTPGVVLGVAPSGYKVEFSPLMIFGMGEGVARLSLT